MGTSSVTIAGNSEQGGGGVAPALSFTAVKQGAGPVLARAFRFFITGPASGYVNLWEVFARSAIGGPNIISGGSPIYSTQNHNNAPANYAANVFDGISNGQKWVSEDGNSAPHYIGYDFGAGVFKPIAAIEAFQIGFTDFQIQFALQDNLVNWTTMQTFAGFSEGGTDITNYFYPPVTQYTGEITTDNEATEWTIAAIEMKSGTIIGGTTFTGNAYTLNLPYAEVPYAFVVSQKVDYPWLANKVAEENDLLVPSDPIANPHLFRVLSITGDGSLGATEPTYSLTGPTVSNNVTLEYVAPLIAPVTRSPILL
jgi:hypothetical protein